MLRRALDGGVDAAWVVADAVYGDSRRLGMMLEDGKQPYALALSGKAYVWAGIQQHRVGDVLDALRHDPDVRWQQRSAGDGAKGPRVYDWLRLPLTAPVQDGFARWLLVRRSLDELDNLTAYTVFAPTGTALAALARVAGSRWHGWHRHIMLALVAHAVLATMRAAGQDIEASAPEPPQKGGRIRPERPAWRRRQAVAERCHYQRRRERTTVVLM